ncbi:Homeodomain-like protein, partial [Tribonema minus]
MVAPRYTPPRKWAPDEDERLNAAVQAHGATKWKRIAAQVGTRNHVQCLQRWKKVLRPDLKKGDWTPEEDALLTDTVQSGTCKNWGKVALHLPNRTYRQCQLRWQHHLDPDIKRGSFTAAEDALILEGFKRFGNRWKHIARKHLPGRIDYTIRGRY